MANDKSRYVKIIEKLFEAHYNVGDREIPFSRSEIEKIASGLGIDLPKNLGDIIYSFRYRSNLPVEITNQGPQDYEWIIMPNGIGRYKFLQVKQANFPTNNGLLQTKIPNSTPGIVIKYSYEDEQALLAKIRYNRLIDIFTGVTCYSLQNHLRTTVRNMGQVETDEIYVGLDKHGVHYIFPVQAKSKKDKISAVQILQDFAVCKEKYPGLLERPIAAKFLSPNVIALLEFSLTEDGPRISNERHYKLVPPEELTINDLEEYKKHL
jgi:hypothetical protein